MCKKKSLSYRLNSDYQKQIIDRKTGICRRVISAVEKNEAGKIRDVPRWQEWEQEQVLNGAVNQGHAEKRSLSGVLKEAAGKPCG